MRQTPLPTEPSPIAGFARTCAIAIGAFGIVALAASCGEESVADAESASPTNPAPAVTVAEPVTSASDAKQVDPSVVAAATTLPAPQCDEIAVPVIAIEEHDDDWDHEDEDESDEDESDEDERDEDEHDQDWDDEDDEDDDGE